MSKTIFKKIKAKELMISAENQEVQFSNDSQNVLAILNLGLANSIQSELILDKINEFVQLKEFILLPNKSYCFLKFENKQDAETAYEKLNGKHFGQNSAPLLISYCSKHPASMSEQQNPPKGLILLKDFIDENLEKALISKLKWASAVNSLSADNDKLKHRQVQHFGYEFLYSNNNVDINVPLDEKIPKECDLLWHTLANRYKEFSDFRPDQLTVNRYEPKQGIPAHCDTHSCFCDPIVSLSLNSSTVMEFKNPQTGKHYSLQLPRRSLLIMSDEARYGWTHGIVPKMSDIVKSSSGFLTVVKRELRYSFTFRKIQVPRRCECIFPHLCDLQVRKSTNNEVDERVAAKLEIKNVHNVYNEIGSHFSETRHSPWPNVENFIKSLEENSIMLDVGCGNGKYLGINDKILKFGCDRSDALLQVCRERNFQVFQCDCLQIPIVDETIDACISIAVIHHLATRERRLKAIKEMLRVLRTGGLALIYVWAKNQEKDEKKTLYLLQNQKKNDNEIKSEEIATLNIDETKIDLPIHRNRTQFNHTNILVPWKLRENQQKVFLRYYHVFEDGELETLCSECKEAEIEKSYYDQGNHCVILRKL